MHGVEALLAGTLALVVGVVLGPRARGRPALLAAVDGLVLAGVGGILLVHVLPWSLAAGGVWAAVAAAIGALVPWWLERRRPSSSSAGRPRWLGAALVGLGLVAHAFMDGGALSGHELPGDPHGEVLALGVVLHRLPVGLALGLFATRRGAWGGVALLTFGTTLGLATSEHALPALGTEGIAIFQAAIAGTLAHVLLSHPPAGVTRGASTRKAGALGAFLGIAVTVGLAVSHPLARHCAEELRAQDTLLHLALESAPALVLAFLGAGLFTFVKAEQLAWLGRGRSLSQALRGVLVGLPIPVCSCGVLPVYRGLVRRGAPPAAAVAFLVATPELGVDAVLLSWPLLGPHLTVVRVVLAAAVAVAVALFVGWGASARAEAPAPEPPAADPAASPPAGRPLARWFASVDGHARHLLPWMVLGLLMAAAVEPLIHDAALTELPSWAQVPLGALLGLPLYVCASGSTPLAAVLMHKGLSAGAVLALLLTGPATNITTFGVLRSLHGAKVAWRFAFGMLLFATLGGWMVDAFVPLSDVPVLHRAEEEPASLLSWAALAVIGGWLLRALWLAGPRGFVAAISVHDHPPDAPHAHGGASTDAPAISGFVLAPARTAGALAPASHDHDHGDGCCH